MTVLPNANPRRASALLFALLLSACAIPTARMPTPGDLASAADVLEVAHRSRASGLLVDESFDIGPYQVRRVKRGISASQGASIGALSTESGRQSFRYEFKGQQDWQGHCELRTRDNGFQATQSLRLEDSRANLQCSCTSPTREVHLQLSDQGRSVQGSMTLDSSRHAMQQERFGLGDGGLRAPAMGYRVESPEGRTMAAVEVLHPGRIWQQRDLPLEQREPQACLFSGLMLYGAQ